MKTTLTVEIEYDPSMTDPEGLASVMDRLLETAMSTPDIMSEYGNPNPGEFYVAKEPVVTAPKVTRAMNEQRQYTLHIDGKLFRGQRELLMRLLALVHGKQAYQPKPGDEGLLEGLVNLTDAIADQAHDRHGIDCLLG